MRVRGMAVSCGVVMVSVPHTVLEWKGGNVMKPNELQEVRDA